MARRLRPIGHEDRLSVVDHLDELRSRLVICAAALVVAFGFCFAFSGPLLDSLNKPLDHLSKTARNHISGVAGDQVGERQYLLKAAGNATLLSQSPHQALADRAQFGALAQNIAKAAQELPKKTPGVVPLTTGVGEPFTQTLSVCIYAALVITLPLLLYEAFAFVIPALKPREKAAAIPIMISAPVLFYGGAAFTYAIVLPAAIKFLQGYNSDHFNSLIQAKQLYSFEVLTMGAIGLAFEMPIALLGLQAAGIIDGNTLTTHWRYAVVILAVIAAAMPGADPVTTALETAPLAVLFVASIFLLKFVDRRKAKREAAEGSGSDDLPSELRLT